MSLDFILDHCTVCGMPFYAAKEYQAAMAPTTCMSCLIEPEAQKDPGAYRVKLLFDEAEEE